ncbi:MAG: M1 family metallopeptidase [Acidobacteria bacterium]|nr:M1 family metallopeptidase [Acidobacteriota bacterium]
MMYRKSNILSLFVLSVFLAAGSFAQRELGAKPTKTGGPLVFEQAAFDVESYELSFNVIPDQKKLEGHAVMTAKIVIPTNVIILDLDTPYKVLRVSDGSKSLQYEREESRIKIFFPQTKQVGEKIKTSVWYEGVPRIAPNPPWVGGFMWTKTPSGADWISIAMQNDGADLLFPVKDHPSDKPDKVTMDITVPDPLFAVGPGKLEKTRQNANNTTTFTWRMTHPIPNYSILFDAAPYRVIKDSVKSITGEMIPIEFYILPESFENGQKLIDETKKYNAFYEKYLGPFPFRSQKLGIVETPHLGMEHSTHLAYGNKFRYNEDGYDWLQLHEFGHEWWANLVTATDWRDFWIHEGFQSYMDSLYLEHLGKKDKYMEAMRRTASRTRNKQPVAPREQKFSYEVYLAGPDFVSSDGDIYGKGAVILHTLRYLIGDDAFFRSLRRMAYPTKEMETYTDGRQTRLVNTDDLLNIAETESGMKLDWFFELYLRQPELPKLVSNINGGQIELHWDTPNNMPFPMPIDIVVGNGKPIRFSANNQKQTYIVSCSECPPISIDPNGWVLKSH